MYYIYTIRYFYSLSTYFYYTSFLYKIEKEQREKDQEEYSTNIRILTISYCIAPQNQKKRTV